MQCASCGHEIDEGSDACPHCGARTSSSGAASTPARDASAGSSGAGLGDPTRPLTVRRKVVVALATVVAVASLCASAFFAVSHATQRRHAVSISIDAPKYSDEASRIPLHVTGVDTTAANMDEIVYVTGGSPVLELAAGEYDISPAASPLLSDGNVYKMPKGSVHVSVSSDGEGKATGFVGDQKNGEGGEGKITFTVADPKTVSDAYLATARRYAEDDAANVGKADELAKKAQERRAESTGGAENDQERLAFLFARTYFDSAKLGAADEEGLLPMTHKENWEKSCRGYIAKGTRLYDEFDPEKTKGSANAREDFPWGCPGYDAVFSEAKVLESSGKKTKVNARYYVGDGSIEEGYKDAVDPASTDITITFDDKNKIVGLEADAVS